MNLLMFPKMLASHDAGWVWLTRLHPSVLRVFWLYVAPMSLIPPAMLLYAAHAYGTSLLGIAPGRIWMPALLFYQAELIAIPLLALAIQRAAAKLGPATEYHDAFAFAAVVPTPVWLSTLALFIPNPVFWALFSTAGLFASALLVFEGNYRVFGIEDDALAGRLTVAVLSACLVAWAVMLGLALLLFGWAAA